MQVMSLFGLLLLCCSLAQAGEEVGFLRGNIRRAIIAKGDISLNCRDLKEFSIYSCRARAMAEGDFDYFIGPPGVPADKVILTAVRQDGSHRTKKVDYDINRGRSHKVNLWENSFLHNGFIHRALLKAGRNKINYVMKKGDRVTARGEFTVKVVEGGQKVCPTARYWEDFIYICPSKLAACERFFQDNNYCASEPEEAAFQHEK